jgi:Methyltransferase FkbM domain
MTMQPTKATNADFIGRFREIISDPLNLLIERMPMAGVVEGNEVYLHNGNRVPVVGPSAYYGSFSQILAINRGVHEPLEEFTFQELLRTLPEAPAMIELGAYWGHYSMWLKRLKPRARVILVEPDRENLAAGKQNFLRNRLEGEFVQAVVGRDYLKVDSFLEERALSVVDVLHVDIEGAEMQMLEGCQAALAARQIRYLLISTHSQELHTQVIAELRRLGYRIEVASDLENETTSFDGFVFAGSPDAPRIFGDFSPLGRVKIAHSQPAEILTALLAARNAAEPSA